MYCLILSCTSDLSTLCIPWYYYALVFLAHCVLFEISLTNFEALLIQVNALNIEINLSTIDFDLTWLQRVGNLKNNVTGRRSQNQWQLLSASIWYQSLGWWWCWFNVSRNLFLTRMSHHLVEPFDSMNYHWFRQRIFSNWVEQDLFYKAFSHQNVSSLGGTIWYW